jgi:hypothetical protein
METVLHNVFLITKIAIIYLFHKTAKLLFGELGAQLFQLLPYTHKKVKMRTKCVLHFLKRKFHEIFYIWFFVISLSVDP